MAQLLLAIRIEYHHQHSPALPIVFGMVTHTHLS